MAAAQGVGRRPSSGCAGRSCGDDRHATHAVTASLAGMSIGQPPRHLARQRTHRHYRALMSGRTEVIATINSLLADWKGGAHDPTPPANWEDWTIPQYVEAMAPGWRCTRTHGRTVVRWHQLTAGSSFSTPCTWEPSTNEVPLCMAPAGMVGPRAVVPAPLLAGERGTGSSASFVRDALSCLLCR